MDDVAETEERFFESRVRVRFHEVDSYDVVWHGHYVAWLEVGRNELAEAFGAGSGRLEAAGYLLPVIGLRLDYKRPALLDDRVVVRTRLREPRGALFVCDYEVVRDEDGTVLARAETRQVVLNRDRDLLVTLPARLREAAERIRRFHRGEGAIDGNARSTAPGKARPGL